MKSFSDDRADKAFIEIAKLIADYRLKNPDVIDTEIAYALLGTAVSTDFDHNWFMFLEEALGECINKEYGH